MKKSFGVWIIIILALIAYYAHAEDVPTVKNVKLEVVQSKTKKVDEKPKRKCINGLLYYIKKDGTLIRVNDENGYPVECDNP